MPDLAAFALACLLIELTPGPNMVWLAILAATEGRAKGFAAVAGVALGLALIGALAAAGVAALIEASALLYGALRWGGALYMLWLAWEGWRGAAEPPEPGRGGLGRGFRRGLVTNLLNPKAAVFYVAVLPAFVPGRAAALAETLALTAVHVAIATAVHAAIVAAAGAARALFADPVAERRLRRGLSALLALVALWILWKTAR